MTTIVVKYGGSVADSDPGLLAEIAEHAARGVRIVIVHGGGPEVTKWLTRLDHQAAFVQGQRVTDEQTLAVAEMVLSGSVGKRIVRSLLRLGAKAAGISGEDGNLLRVAPYDQKKLGFVGRVVQVDLGIVQTLLAAGYIPVVAPLGLDAEQQVYNINADLAAGAIAAELHADALVLATDVEGVRKDPHSPAVIRQLSWQQAREMIVSGSANGGMIPKLEAALATLTGGTKAAHIVDGRRPGVLSDLLGGNPSGTTIVTPISAGEGGVCYA